MSRARFRERVASTTVTIEGPPGELMFCVRPLGGRRLYAMSLANVARVVVHEVRVRPARLRLGAEFVRQLARQLRKPRRRTAL